MERAEESQISHVTPHKRQAQLLLAHPQKAQAVESDSTAKVDISNEEVVNIQEGVLRLELVKDEVLTREVLDSPSLIFLLDRGEPTEVIKRLGHGKRKLEGEAPILRSPLKYMSTIKGLGFWGTEWLQGRQLSKWQAPFCRIFRWPRRGARTCPPPPMPLSVLVWNCQGLGNAGTVQYLTSLIKRVKPTCVFLSETKCHLNNIERFKRKLGFSHIVYMEPQGKAEA